MNLELQGKVAIVTGASKGIGLSTVAALLDEGAHVVANSRTSTPELDAQVARGATVVLADITDADTPQRLVDAALSTYGRLDVLVNNVGAGSVRSGFLDVDDTEWARVFDVTFFSAVRTSRAALPALLDNGGTIVNISSINARLPFPMVVDYSAAKAAVANLTKTLSEEFAPRGVRVNAVSPGPVRTPFWTGPDGFAHAVAAGAGSPHSRRSTRWCRRAWRSAPAGSPRPARSPTWCFSLPPPAPPTPPAPSSFSMAARSRPSSHTCPSGRGHPGQAADDRKGSRPSEHDGRLLSSARCSERGPAASSARSAPEQDEPSPGLGTLARPAPAADTNPDLRIRRGRPGADE